VRSDVAETVEANVLGHTLDLWVQGHHLLLRRITPHQAAYRNELLVELDDLVERAANAVVEVVAGYLREYAVSFYHDVVVEDLVLVDLKQELVASGLGLGRHDDAGLRLLQCALDNHYQLLVAL